MTFPVGGLDAAQLDLIEAARSFVDRRAARGLDVALEPECYLTAWAPTRGNARLRRLAFGLRAEPQRVLARTRDFLGSLRSWSLTVAGNEQPRRDFDDMIVSWALPRDFDAEGHYSDRYFGLASRHTPATLWVLVLLEGPIPQRLAPNVRVLHQAPGGVWRGGFSGIKGRAQEIASAVVAELQRAPVRKVILPYEAQPFQHATALAVKAHDARIPVIGYLHSSLPALPTDFLFRCGAPDRLLVHGVGQAEILRTRLGWPAERLATVASLRYLSDRVTPFEGRILLPYSFADERSIVDAFEAFVRAAPQASLPRWTVRVHPVRTNAADHLALAKRLESIVARYADRIAADENAPGQTVIVGATGAVIEALERGLDVVHLCPEPLFEKHSAELWSRIEVEAIAFNAYRYRLRERGAYIRFGASAAESARTLEIATC